MKKFKVTVHANSKKPKIEKNGEEKLEVYVSAPAIEGKANQAVIEVLSKYFQVSKNQIFLVRGLKSKNKIFEIETN